MPSIGNIRLLRNHEIDKAKWDDTIKNAANSLVYAYSFYLDTMSPGWTALVDRNYDWILPLTWRKKFGIIYLYQPAFIQQAGVFLKNDDVEISWHQIILQLQKQFRFCEMYWNFKTDIKALPISISTKPNNNFIIDLGSDYESIASKYHKDLERNLKRAEKHVQHFCETNDFEKAIELYKTQYSSRFPHVTENDYDRFRKVCIQAKDQNKLHVYEMRDDNGHCTSIALLLKDDRRIYNLMNTTTDAGRNVQANHLLFDNIIRHYAQTQLVLDFEGSDLPGVKHFYENFGAVNQPYYFIKYNHLPWPLRLFKH